MLLDNEGMDALLKSHAIDPKPLREDDYEAFIESRRALILQKIERAMGKSAVAGPDFDGDDDPDDDGDE